MPGAHKRRILAAERAWARSEGLLRALVERGVYVIGGLTHRPSEEEPTKKGDDPDYR